MDNLIDKIFDFITGIIDSHPEIVMVALGGFLVWVFLIEPNSDPQQPQQPREDEHKRLNIGRNNHGTPNSYYSDNRGW